MSARVVSFVLLCEGTSDQGLVPHLETLLVDQGACEAIGTADSRKGSVLARLSQVLNEGPSIDLVFVHRDADGPSRSARDVEIADAVAASGCSLPYVAVVPVYETEAWLLVDQESIRAVAGRPNGTTRLGLPRGGDIELTRNPKELLGRALAEASEKSGRRLQQEKKLFNERRRVLLQRLDPYGPVRQLGSWAQLELDIERAAAKLGVRP